MWKIKQRAYDKPLRVPDVKDSITNTKQYLNWSDSTCTDSALVYWSIFENTKKEPTSYTKPRIRH